jgi:hypothetical protein
LVRPAKLIEFDLVGVEVELVRIDHGSTRDHLLPFPGIHHGDPCFGVLALIARDNCMTIVNRRRGDDRVRLSKVWQHNNSMELDLRLMDGDVFTLTMMERNRELADLDVEIAKKRLEIFELQGTVAISGRK